MEPVNQETQLSSECATHEMPSILVVDDEDAVCRIIERQLIARDYRVSTAHCYDDAWKVLDSGDFDLLITDHMMAGKKGLDLIVEANKSYPDIVKILLTGAGNRELYREAINRGSVFSVMEKPFRADVLIDTVEHALEQRQQRLTEREETQRFRELYRNLFDNTTDLIQCISGEGKLIYVNPVWHRVLGYDYSHMESLDPVSIIAPGSRNDFTTVLMDVRKGRKVKLFEVEMLSCSGTPVYLEGSAASMMHDHGGTGVTFILRDITARKHAEAELEARLRQETMVARIAEMLARADEPVSVYEEVLEVLGPTINSDRAYMFALDNERNDFSRYYIWSSSESGRVGARDVTIEQLPETFKRLISSDMVIFSSTDEISEPDRSVFINKMVNAALIHPIVIGKKVVGLLGIDTRATGRQWDSHEIDIMKAAGDIIANAWIRQRDIELRKQKEREAEHSNILVIRADRLAALGTMAAGIVHEITQPMNVINVSSQTIKYGLTRGWSLDGEQIQNSLDLIIEQIKRMSTIIDNMRTFARDGVATARTAGDLNREVDRVFALIGEQMRVHDIDVEFFLGDIPETLMNPQQILQVILNLITNARQALDDVDNEEKKIIITTYFKGDYIYLEVADNGPGVSSDLKNKIFDPFFTTKEVGKGTGLGLSISMGIINEHHGELDVHANSMGGATFVMRLPYTRPAKETP